MLYEVVSPGSHSAPLKRKALPYLVSSWCKPHQRQPSVHVSSPVLGRWQEQGFQQVPEWSHGCCLRKSRAAEYSAPIVPQLLSSSRRVSSKNLLGTKYHKQFCRTDKKNSLTYLWLITVGSKVREIWNQITSTPLSAFIFSSPKGENAIFLEGYCYSYYQKELWSPYKGCSMDSSSCYFYIPSLS